MSKHACDLEIITCNVRGLGDFSKRKDIFDFLRGQSADVICLQEVHIASGMENLFRNQWGGRAWFSANSSMAGGVGILIQNETVCKVLIVITPDNGNTIILNIEVCEARLQIINVYGPSDRDDSAFFEKVFSLASSEQIDHTIYCGDWNLTLDPSVDTFNYQGRDRRTRSRKLVKTKCKELDLHEVWRELNGDKVQYTWRKRNPLKCARLDYFLITGSLLSKTLSCEILPAYRTDHSRVALRLKLAVQLRGRGFWKLNCSLLRDPNYLQMTKQVIVDTVRSYACPIYAEYYVNSLESREDIQFTISDELFLETLLMNIRAKTIMFSIQKRRHLIEKEDRLLKELNECESLPNPSSQDIETIEQKQLELKTLRNPRNEGRIVRSRVRWYEEGERSSSGYFLQLERRNFESKQMPCLETNGEVVYDSHEILNARLVSTTVIFLEKKIMLQ